MNTGTIIAIGIVVLSIVLVIVAIFMTQKKVAPTLNNIKELNDVITEKQQFYTREGQHLNDRVTQLTDRVEVLQVDVENKVERFKDLADEQGEFQVSLGYLQDHAGDYTKGISTNLKNEIKEDGPKILETFKRTFKKTAQKQKAKFQNK